ncbi:diguanylate cyclase [Caenispirillum salinarum]|uniref:sensor domain-containing diguanylate cyclase n=1 Tax=Caenispirillum salinarum TaxID=859058 RepID=UPI00384C9A30
MKGRAIAWSALALAACATLSLGLWVLDRDGRAEAVENAFELTRARVAVADARVSGALGEVSQVLRSVEDYLRVLDLPQRLRQEDQLFVASRAADQEITREMIVVSSAGEIIGHSGMAVPPVINVSDRDYFRAFADRRPERGLFVGRPITSRTTGQSVIPVARGIYTEAGFFAGVVAAAVKPVDLLRVLPAAGPANGTAVLLREDGIVLAREPFNDDYVGRDASQAPLFTRYLPAAPEGSFATVSPLDQRERLVSYEHDPQWGTVTLVSVGRPDVLATHDDMTGAYLMIGGMGNALLVLLFAMVYRQTTRRRRAVEALLESRAALARLNEELEARVVERTLDLQHSEARSRAFMDAAHDAVIVTDQDDNILEFNPAAMRVFGYSDWQVARLRFGDLVPDYDPDRPEDAVARHADGRLFPAECWAGELAGDAEAGSMVFIIRDISRRKRAEAKLVELATTDGLTGALNRRAFMERATEAHALARRHGRPFSIAMIDADHFKAINDTHGHEAGDAVLKALVTAIAGELRETDGLGRLGGEEFAAMLPETDHAGAAVVAERIRLAVAETHVPYEGIVLSMTVSVGLATTDAGTGETLEGILKRADDALYAAKTKGRDRVVTAEPPRQTVV